MTPPDNPMREPAKKKSPSVSDPLETREDRRFARNSLIPPIFQSTTFPFECSADLAAFHAGELDAFFTAATETPPRPPPRRAWPGSRARSAPFSSPAAWPRSPPSSFPSSPQGRA